MLSIANKLGSEFNFVRVDLYEVNSRPLFGELTFAPGAGIKKIEPPERAIWAGDLWP